MYCYHGGLGEPNITHTHTHTHVRTHACTHTHTHTHARTHACMHTHTHTHNHTINFYSNTEIFYLDRCIRC